MNLLMYIFGTMFLVFFTFVSTMLIMGYNAFEMHIDRVGFGINKSSIRLGIIAFIVTTTEVKQDLAKGYVSYLNEKGKKRKKDKAKHDS
jgi:hypothetical protein